MGKKIVAIVGSYRKNGIVDSAVTKVLEGAQTGGADTVKIYLTEKRIEFCNNCRSCTQEPGDKRGQCVHDDDMEEILRQIDDADAYILGSPVNFGSATAITKRFMERLVVYAYWPWGKITMPKLRNAKLNKKAVVVTSATPPGWLGRIILPGTVKQLRSIAKVIGAKQIKCLYFGMAPKNPDSTLDDKYLNKAFESGRALVAD